MEQEEDIDAERRQFLVTATTVMAGMGLLASGIPLAAALWPTEKTEAQAEPITVDIRHLQPGSLMTVAWRGKPIWILRRTKAMLNKLAEVNPQLRDPNSLVAQQPVYAHNQFRSIIPEYLVLVGVCTHLGCIPNYRPEPDSLDKNWQGGFYCPCHGSKFDLAGRVMKDVPAPINLEVPPYYFLDLQTIIIGAEAKHGGE